MTTDENEWPLIARMPMRVFLMALMDMPISWTYTKTAPNVRYGHLMPPEDAVKVRGMTFAVADGITRDPLRPKNFHGKSTEEILRCYPNPSGARIAAETFCEAFTRGRIRGVDDIQTRFTIANRRIAALNRINVPSVDYLAYDLWGCVASGGCIRENVLYWGAVGDCEIVVVNARGRLRFRSGDGMWAFTRFERNQLQRPNYDWSLPEYRARIRRDFRNNPNARWYGRCVGYGALTGGRTAEAFLRLGSLRLTRGDTVAAFTDGFTPFITHRAFSTILRSIDPITLDQCITPWALGLARRDPERYGKERSTIIIRFM